MISLPYITLAVLVLGLFVVRSRKITIVFLAAQVFLGFIYEIVTPAGLFAVAAFWGVAALHWRYLSSREWVNAVRILCLAAIAIGFSSHLVPGFHNLRVFEGIVVSPTSMPFTMYLNFDKTIAAVIIAMASGLLIPFGVKSWRDTLMIAGFCVALLIPMATSSGYVQFDPKFPEAFWLWAFNNLLFVCFAEEVIFRGLIQGYLSQIAARYALSSFIPLVVSALLFGVMHFHGGPLYIGFATVAGLFYGYAYYRTQRLESAILVHFFLNLCHFLFFSYPAAATFVK